MQGVDGRLGGNNAQLQANMLVPPQGVPQSMPGQVGDPGQFIGSGGGSHSDSSVDEEESPELLAKLDGDEYHERIEWQKMLTAALTGQVVDSEKKRLNSQADSSLFNLTDSEYAEHLSVLLQSLDYNQLFRNIHTDIWIECRAVIRGRTLLQEKQTLESLRAIHTDATLRAVMDFNVDRVVATPSGDDAITVEFSAACLSQLQKLLRRVDYVEGLYPTLRALSEAKPIYASQPFQNRLAALTSWTNISVRLGLLHTMIQQWTGSHELSFYSTTRPGLYVSTTAGITKDGQSSEGSAAEAAPAARSLSSKGYHHTPFVERLLKENGMRKIFEHEILKQLDGVVQSARRDLIENSGLLADMGLPVINGHMQELLRFPPRLLQTCLMIRLQSAENLNNPAMVQVDQLLDDIRDSLSVACRVKRSFKSLTGPTSSWNPGVQLDPEYDQTLHSYLQMYFRLLHRKLNISSEVEGTKVFEVLENQWPFLLEVVRNIEGGQHELALRYCQQARFLVQLWTRILARLLKGPDSYDSMSSRELSKWFSSALQAIRSPILRGQRLMRTIHNAVANSTDYEFDDPFPLLAQLVDSKHVLVYTSGEWESRGVYIIGSQALLQKPQLVRELLASCIVDDVLSNDQYRDCYLLAIRTDAEFNWTGTSVVPQGEAIRYQDLELSPGQMRLISPGVERLERHRKWLERINIAAELQGWETATAVTDEIIEDWIKSRLAQRHSTDDSQGGGKRVRPSSTSRLSDIRPAAAAAAAAAGSTGVAAGSAGAADGERAHSDASAQCRGPRAMMGSSSYGGVEDDVDDFDEAKSDYAALRPSLEPYDKRLARINTPGGRHSSLPGWSGAGAGAGAAEDGGGEASKPGAPARVRELVRAHNPLVQREWSLLKYGVMRMMDALTQVPDMLRTLHVDFHSRRWHEDSRGSSSSLDLKAGGGGGGGGSDAICRGESCDLLEQVQESFSFVSNTAARATRLLDLKAERYVRLALLHMCVGWCGFITEDCMANDKRTFGWAVQALEYAMQASKHNTVQVLPGSEWQLLKAQVAGCLTLMISHFDILGARNEESLHNEKLKEERDHQALRRHMDDPKALLSLDGIGANYRTHQMQRQRVQHAQQADACRDRYLHDNSRIGRVLEVTTARPQDQTLRLLVASPSNINIRWRIGSHIGGGAFGSVFAGHNLDTGEMMAVKEIRFPSRPLESARGDHPGHRIAREMEVMSMLQHPNIVTYYGIEVHRDKVYLFMELCSKGSLAQMIRDQGRIDEDAARVFVVQMLRGLRYLHAAGICHRDIKCDNTLLDDAMTIKLVDFGAAKVLDRQSLAASRRAAGGMSLTGTPMYMAPEVIQGGSSGATASQGGARAASLGAMDIWALGCCVVEMVTGKPPWAHLDNEWAIMYQVVQGNPRLPDASEISADGLRFIRRCFARHPADRPPADELLRDRWVAGTVRSMERLEAHGLPVGRLAAVAAAGSSAEYLDLMAAATAAADDDNDDDDDDDSAGDEQQQQQQQHLGLAHHHHRMHSIGSVSSNNNNSGNNPPGGRSRVASISRKHAPGDLRFITSATGGPSGEAMLSMMDHNRSKAAAGISAGESIVDRSPGFSGAGQPMAVGPSMSVGHTPGSPNSATSLHAAWPFNKDTAAASLRSSAHAHAAFNSSINSGGGGVDSAAAVVMSLGTPEPLSSTGEDLVAIYSSPSLIYQMLSGNNTAGSPAHSASGVGSMSTPLGHLPSALISGVMESPLESAVSGSISQFSVRDGHHSRHSSKPTSPSASNKSPVSDEQLGSAVGHFSSDEIQDLSETTRKAVAAMLSMPLEGADVAGVSGWLGEGYTPMEMLNEDEVKETLATTSHIVVRERELHLRRQQQEMRHLLHRQQVQNIVDRQQQQQGGRDGSRRATSVDAKSDSTTVALLAAGVGPQSESRVDLVVSHSLFNKGDEQPQRSEPPALYPLPSDEENN